MKSAGFSLIELLVVISITSILAVMGFVNFKDFSSNQISVKAAGEIQTILRLAQSNATSSTLCNNKGVTSWFLNFRDKKTIELRCEPEFLQKAYELEYAEVVITGDSGCSINLPANINFLPGEGIMSISSSFDSDTACLNSPTITITVKNTLNNGKDKMLKISKGGVISIE